MAGRPRKEIYTYVKECADCGSKDIRVPASYTSADGSFRRYRECADCGYRFTTIEVEECASDVAGLLDENSRLRASIKSLTKRNKELARINDCLTQQRDELLTIHVGGTDELFDQLTDEELTQNFVSNCRYYCKVRGMTIRDFEKSIDLSIGYLKKCADRNVDVGIRTIYKASLVLGVSIDHLLSPREEDK